MNPAKRAMRREIRGRLAGVTAQRWGAASSRAVELVLALPEFARASCVMMFAPMAGEVDIAPVSLACERAGKRVLLPRIDWERVIIEPVPAPSADFSSMTPGRYSLREPGPEVPAARAAEIDLVLVPGLAFDARGGRLGHGKGFYDRFLASPGMRAFYAGVAIAEQLVPEVPMEQGDIRVHAVITDEGTLRVS